MIQKLVLFNIKSKRERERAKICKSSCSMKRALKKERREKSDREKEARKVVGRREETEK